MRRSFVFLGGLVLGLTSHCFAVDSDGDGLDDSVETNTGVYVDENDTGTDPNNPDTDGDFLKDGLEVSRGLSPVTHFDFSGDETSYTYIPAVTSDGTTLDWSSPLATWNSISSEDVWDIANGAVVTQASVAYDPPAERVLGYYTEGVILGSNTDYIFNIPEPKLIKGLYIHTDGDRSTSSFRLYFKDDSGAWIEHANVSFLDSGRIPYTPQSRSIIFVVDFPDFVASEFKMQFGSSNSRLVGSQPRILEVDAVTETLPTFQIVEGNFTWQEAKADAEAKGGRLAVLDTQEKIDSLGTYLDEIGFQGQALIGLTDEDQEGEWEWVDGTPLSISNWDVDQPVNNNNNNQDYVYISDRFWHDTTSTATVNNYLLEILERPPAPPVVELDSFYESNPLEEIVVDATPSAGFPEEFTYQWSFNDQPIPSFLGGALPTFNLLGDQSQDGTWKVVVSNTVGTTEASFEYRMFVDNDSDGLSNYREVNFTLTNPDLADSDADGLSDPDELSIHGTDPNIADVDEDGLNDSEEIAATTDPSVADTDNDGLLDGAEVKTYASNPKSGDTDNDGIADAAEVAAGLDINTAESIAAAVAFLTQELANRPPVDGFEEAIAAARTTGQEDVTSDPSAYNLYNAASYQAVVDQRDARPTTAEYALVLEERDSRPSLQAYNAVVADRDSRPTKEAYDAVVAQRDARPTADAYDTAIAERDARPTLGEVADARLGSVVLLPDAIENKVRLRFSIEESDELGLWTMRTEEAEVDLPLTAGKRFFRFSVKEGE
ncbi:hypothetical protein N9173_00810 [bacterium]|nr:hypothetical protein [bacterium]